MNSERTVPYSLRGMPLSMRHELKAEAALETEKSEKEGNGRVTQNDLILAFIREGIDRRKADRKAAASATR